MTARWRWAASFAAKPIILKLWRAKSSRALMDLSVSRKLPLGNGILTVELEEQAIVRADPGRATRAATRCAPRSHWSRWCAQKLKF